MESSRLVSLSPSIRLWYPGGALPCWDTDSRLPSGLCSVQPARRYFPLVVWVFRPFRFFALALCTPLGAGGYRGCLTLIGWFSWQLAPAYEVCEFVAHFFEASICEL